MLFDLIFGVWSYFWRILTSFVQFLDSVFFGIMYEFFNYIPDIVSAFFSMTEAITFVDKLLPVYTLFLICFFILAIEALVFVVKIVISLKKAFII